MASALIHIAVANELNKQFKMEREALLIGSIAPDLAKLIGETKHNGHFLTTNKDIPDTELFISKYNINTPYEMGYFIHLYTDKIWFRDFLPRYYNKKELRLVTGEFIELAFEDKLKLIYSDYSSLNIMLKRKYNLDLDFLNSDCLEIHTPVTEIDSTRLKILLENVSQILKESKETKLNVFREKEIIEFINACVKEIKEEVENGKLITCK